MQKLFLFIICCTLLFAFNACSARQDVIPENNAVQQPGPDTPQSSDAGSVQQSDVPSEVMDWFEGFGHQKGAYIYQHPNYTYIKINAGQKPTGGYDIKIRKLIDNDYEKKITVEFTQPNPGQLVMEVITYPSIIFKVDSDCVSMYDIETIQGEKLKIENKTITAAIELPQRGDVVSNPVRVKGKIAVFEGCFVVRILDENGKILKEAVLQTAGAPVWGDFDEMIEYSSSQTAKGSIEAGWYSAKDGEYIMLDKVDIKFKS